MIFAELVSPNCWLSMDEQILLLPYPEALRSELRCSDNDRHAVGFVLDMEKEQPVLLKVCSKSEDEMGKYVATGKWAEGTTFEKIDHTKTDLRGIVWFGEDLMVVRKKVPEPYATRLENFVSELLAHGIKIS